MVATIGMAELKTAYPYESGLIAKTTKQAGRRSYLVAESGSRILTRDTIGIR